MPPSHSLDEVHFLGITHNGGLSLSSVNSRENRISSFSVPESCRCALRTLDAISGGSNDGKRAGGHIPRGKGGRGIKHTFPGDSGLVWAGSPQENKGEPRRIKKTFSFLSVH